MRRRRVVLLGVLIAAALLAMSPLLVTGAAAQDTTVPDPSDPGNESVHTWTVTDVADYGNSTQELDSITVDYPSGFSFDGLTDANATVIMTRTLSGGTDTSEISLNSRTYSGSSAVLELSGFAQTDVAGPIDITIDGIENAPSEGEYNVSFTLSGDNGTKTVEQSLNITESGTQDTTPNVSDVTIDPGEIQDPSVVNISAAIDGDNLTVEIGTHPTENVTGLAVTAYEQGNRSNVVLSKNYTSDQARTITRQNSTIAAADTWVVQADLFTSDRAEPITRRIFLGDLRTLNVPLDSDTLQVFSLLSIIAVAGLFGGALSAVGGVVVVAMAWVLSAIGWLSISPAFLAAAGVIAIFLAAASRTGGIR